MQYVLIDSHQRFLGTHISEKSMGIGDVFQHEQAHTYTVVGVHQAQQRRIAFQSLTVVRNRPAVQAAH